MQGAARLILLGLLAAVILGGALLIDSIIEPAVDRGRWGVVILIAAGMSPLVGLVTLAWVLIH